MGILIAASVCVAVVFGVGAGTAIARTNNIPQSWNIGQEHASLPTEILSRSGKLIAQYSGPAVHETIPLDKLPKYLVEALLTREDQNFYHESAFSVRGTARAAFNILTGHYFSGGSTITQQLAGFLYANRSKKTIFRKLKELWYAFQLEKRLTKTQILQMYLNTVYFGRNNYGIEAASENYFGHPASQLTLAESAMLVIQLAAPALYDWLKHPKPARDLQHVVLEEMVKKGYVTQEQVDQSFTDFWNTYPYSRPASVSLSGLNTSKAPYFTEYVRQKLAQDLYGNLGYLRDGLVVHTTLNLDDQLYAEGLMHKYIRQYNAVYRKNAVQITSTVTKKFYPVVNLLALGLNLPQMSGLYEAKAQKAALSNYLLNVNPSLDVLSMMFGLNAVHFSTIRARLERQKKEQKTTVQGALIAIRDHSGEIVTMVGGYNFAASNFNRAVDSAIQPGSSIKPLYYSAAISSGELTAASMLPDRPVVFFNPDGTIYRPYDFLGQWQGRVSLRWALQDSINVPSLEVLQKVGFTAAINRVSRLLGMENEKNNPSYFPHLWPLGLGITPVAPINMVRAYATFTNQGREVVPVAIRYVQDRKSGNIILQPEHDLAMKHRSMGKRIQIMSPQAAYVMVDLLKSVVSAGTLWRTYFDVGGWGGMPMGGKTGTTENWADAWTVGFSPYYTSAVWFGFDQLGGSLGLGLTGATGAGPVWAHFMKFADTGKKVIPFPKPTTGLVRENVDCTSGMLPTRDSSCVKNEIFIAGTEPRHFDTLAQYQNTRDSAIVQKLQNSAIVEALSGQSPTAIGAVPNETLPAGGLYGSTAQVAGPPGPQNGGFFRSASEAATITSGASAPPPAAGPGGTSSTPAPATSGGAAAGRSAPANPGSAVNPLLN